MEFKIFVFPEFFIEFVFFVDLDFFEFEIFPEFFFLSNREFFADQNYLEIENFFFTDPDFLEFENFP